ncbi:hypothetical protein RBB50_005203 [Rhinocladiella similis]
MPRLIPTFSSPPAMLRCSIRTRTRTSTRIVTTRTPTTPLRSLSLSSTTPVRAKAPDSTPGWEGRGKEDHAVHRSPHDPQSKGAKEGMKDHEQLKEGSQAISRRDESQGNKKAKQDHPEAPEPVIGMNEERGSKGH